MRKIKFIFVVFAFLPACVVTIDDIKSPVELPAQFSNSGKQKLTTRWWQAFHDEELNKLCEEALANNFSLKTVYNQLQQAQAIAKQAGAPLIPQLNTSLTDTSKITEKDTTNVLSLGLGFTTYYEVDLWGRIRTTQNAAILDVQATQEDVNAAAISLTAKIASTWFKLLEQRQQLDLLARQIIVNEKNVALLQVRYQSSQAAAADVLQQQQLLESSRGNKLTVISTLKVLENQLAVLIGKSPNTVVFAPTTKFISIPELPLTDMPATILQNRPDVKSAYLRIQAANQRIASAIADRFPKLSLSANFGTNSPSLQSFFNNWLATLAGNLVLPILDGGRRIAEVERNEAISQQALNQYANVLLTAVGEVENALIQEKQQQLLVQNLTQQVKLAQDSSDRIRARYLFGAMDFFRVLSAELTLQNLERTRLQAQQQLFDYRIALNKALASD
ncbi:MAG: TolC family protein [Methylococcaceae bacterium]|nr:TolC family protein [Methylococcaceae bacterium]